ncbi:monovalent cation/H(+) antiporter subunit G [Ignisphaera sp. 4213-co]|uniref:Monovalent cation/H(+) antiporter subunit G n=1 Tax=Ignisphaera cupida TaxID=3050454 RepID=A0ABD4Z5B5_9CREN|nr:monovalent cation/H(+) antiporter subunit G [Ignisphaera sp. 4213-co]MDK6028507.1 monovalent cation/H(+) antiporter subunit G [Ignisphaera sp. 4213-co]
MIDMNWVLVIIGETMVIWGAICNLIASIGLLRFPNFYVRLHALTVGTIWGAFVPLIGVGLIAAGSEFLGDYRWFMAGAAFVTATLLLFLAPVGSHAIARAAHKSKAAIVYPKVVDKLEEDREKGEIR